MKKYLAAIISVVVGVVLFLLCFNYNEKDYPNEYYNVYLDDELLGTIASKSELLSYIENNTLRLINAKEIVKTYCEDKRTLDQIIDEYELQNIIDKSPKVNYYNNQNRKCVDITIIDGTDIEKIYNPNGLEIEKVLTYQNSVNSVEEIYSKITSKEHFTVKGYQFTISDGENAKYVYVIDKQIFEDAVKKFIEVYVGKEEYEAYLKGTQQEIKLTGSMLENIYINETITIKEKQIPMDYTIYTSVDDLANFLIYGESPVTQLYKVKNKQMISDIAIENEISNQEFLIANPKYKNNSLIAVGTEVLIKQTNPQLRVVVEKFVVQDKTVNYRTLYQHDETQYTDYIKTIQNGKNGLQRVSQREKSINGSIVYIEPKGKETLRNSIDEIIVKGDKTKPNIGDLNNWTWPSEPGWTNADGWGYRIHPLTGERKFHYGIDIAGTGYNSAIYAANNGTIVVREWHYSYGYYIVVNHNNGYYTLYAHMNKFYPGLKVGDTVLRGQQIGYVGSTGDSTGPHIHYELWKGCYYCRISPWSVDYK